MRVRPFDLVVSAILAALVLFPGRSTLPGAEERPTKEGPPASENEPQAAERRLLREQMSARIAKVKIAPVDAPDQTGVLIGKPLMTYTDESLSINAATLWSWSLRKDGRPIAMCKVEHYDTTRAEGGMAVLFRSPVCRSGLCGLARRTAAWL